MCRIAAYLGGPEIPLSSLVLDPEHSLVEQAHSPREMLSGTVNTDGFGVGWYVPEGAGSAEGARVGEPALYRSGRSIWADRSFASLAGKLASRSIFAAVRNATPGLPVEDSGVPPFGAGPYLFMHNSAVEGFRHTAMRELRGSLSDEAYAGILGVTDSETIFAGLCDRVGATGVTGAEPHRESLDADGLSEALSETIRHVSGVAARAGVQATLNLSVTDGSTMVFSRYSLRGPGNSLYYMEDGRSCPGGAVVASERLDGDPGWREAPDEHLLIVDDSGARTKRLA
jgi:glutamine amidotransferase